MLTRLLERLKAALSQAFHWLRVTPGVTSFAVFVGCLILLLKVGGGYHEHFPKWEAEWEVPRKPMWLSWYETLHPYFGLAASIGVWVWVLALVRRLGNLRRMVGPTLVLGTLILVTMLCKELRDHWWAGRYGSMGEPPAIGFFILKQVMLAVLLLTPALVFEWWSRLKMLQRYTVKAFVQPLVFCYVAFSSLWIMMDLMDKLKDFQDSKVPSSVLMSLYLDLLPAIYVMVTPAAVLLASLYALTKLSRANEIVSMLTSGLSLAEILKPILVFVAYLSLLGMAMNYHWAPNSDGQREAVMRGLERGSKGANGAVAVTALLYRNEQTSRTWSIGSVPFDLLNDKLKSVTIYQFDGGGKLKTVWRARTAKWWAPTPEVPNGIWALYHGTVHSYRGGIEREQQFFDGTVEGVTRIDRTDWTETPWSILSGSMVPDTMGVPQLVAYLRANHALPSEKRAPFRTHLHHRFAFPWQAFVVVLLAAPLGVSFSRRGALGGIAAAVIIFFVLMFVNEFFINMGRGYHMNPMLAAWMPNLIFGSIGWFILQRRSQNKDLPSLSPSALCKQAMTWWQQRKGMRNPVRA